MRVLPANVDDLRGLRGARWFRESTTEQYDNFGPDAQREQQDRAIGRYGVVDTGLEWSVASSGWTSAWRTPTWEAMIASARAGAFDVLVVGYVSRFLRNLKQTLIAIEDHLHAAGVVVLFADERLLSSDPSNWDQFVREAHEAEAYSRKLSKRVGEGYAAKRRRFGVPGGNRPPLGYLRMRSDPANLRSAQKLVVDPDKADVIRRAFELSASGLTDRAVAAAIGLRLTHLREILKNPVHTGQLRTGEASGGPALISKALWDEVIVVRSRYARRHRGPISQRTYALATILACAACGRRLTGHVGRYRHVDACAEFKAARPAVTPWKSPGDGRIRGESYKAEVYDDLVPQMLDRIRVGATTMTQVVAALDTHPDTTFTISRIERDREAALAAYRRDRRIDVLELAMADLDAEEIAARASSKAVSAAEAAAWLNDLPALWEAADDTGRRLLTEAIFEKVEVLGVQSVTIHPTPEADAHGWSDAFGSVPLLLRVGGEVGTDGRGERI